MSRPFERRASAWEPWGMRSGDDEKADRPVLDAGYVSDDEKSDREELVFYLEGDLWHGGRRVDTGIWTIRDEDAGGVTLERRL